MSDTDHLETESGRSHGESPPSRADSDSPSSEDAAAGTSANAKANANASARSRQPPGPDGLPILGNALQLIRNPTGFETILRPHGDVVNYSFFGREFTALLHPDHVERVLVSESDRFEQYAFEELRGEFAPNGLLQATGQQWRRQRSLIQPAFSPAKVAAFADEIVTQTAATVDQWEPGEIVVANRTFSDLTLEILTTTLFDLEVAHRRETIRDATESINDLADPTTLSTYLPEWVPTPTNRRYRRHMNDFDSLVEELIAARRGSEDTGDDLLSTLLEAAENEQDPSLSPSELRDQLVTFLFAGHETTSLALTYACFLLGTHQEGWDRLAAEVDAVCDGRPTMADIPDLSYTSNVIDETLRLYPPAFILLRSAREPVTFDGYRLPKGTVVTMPQFSLHRDPRFWDEPDAFRPTRFEDGQGADRPEYAYFPFGGGPRHCVGMRFARMELTLTLATIASRVRLESVTTDLEFQMGATLKPVDPVRLRVHERERQTTS